MSKAVKYNITWEMADKWVSLHGDADCWKDKIRDAYRAGWEDRDTLIGSKVLGQMENESIKLDTVKLNRELNKKR